MEYYIQLYSLVCYLLISMLTNNLVIYVTICFKAYRVFTLIKYEYSFSTVFVCEDACIQKHELNAVTCIHNN